MKTLKRMPTRCPACKSHDFELTLLSHDEDEAVVQASCCDCMCMWHDHFEYSFSTVEMGDDAE